MCSYICVISFKGHNICTFLSPSVLSKMFVVSLSVFQAALGTLFMSIFSRSFSHLVSLLDHLTLGALMSVMISKWSTENMSDFDKRSQWSYDTLVCMLDISSFFFFGSSYSWLLYLKDSQRICSKLFKLLIHEVWLSMKLGNHHQVLHRFWRM